MDAGEAFTIIDVRNPLALGQSYIMIPGAIASPSMSSNHTYRSLPRTGQSFVLHLTQGGIQREFGAKASGAWLQARLGTAGRSRNAGYPVESTRKAA